jgi:hypothetical protein
MNSARPGKPSCGIMRWDGGISLYSPAGIIHSMQHLDQKDRRPLARIMRALIEVAFIVFLFYSNLLMGEFTLTNGHGKTLAHALNDIFTLTNFAIAMIAALIGHGVFHYLRKKL